MTPWETLGTVSAERLADARLQLHWAAQAAAAVGKQLLDHQPDYGEQSFRWDPAARALVQGQVAGSRPFRSVVRPSPPALLLLGDGGEMLCELPLDGRTLEEAYAWLEAEIAVGRPLERPGEMPSHPVGSGGRFVAADREAFAELAAWLSAGDALLAGVARRNPGASAVRLWPHHFDLATLIALGPPGDPENARSIGVGLVPGDSWKAEPYLYVTPWPYPKVARLPPLDHGSWATEGWTGAYLAAACFLDAPAGERAGRVERFVDSAVAACRRLLER